MLPLQPPSTNPADYKSLTRYEGERRPRFLTCSCFQNQPFFRSERTCLWFIEALELARTTHKFHLWAYVIMPTHVHLLIVPMHESSTIPEILRTLKQSVARRAISWVRAHAPEFLPRMADVHRSGTSHRFWQRGGGYDRNLTTDFATWKAIDYIHLNPVEAGLCQRMLDWPWSSAAVHEKVPNPPITIDFDLLPRHP